MLCERLAQYGPACACARWSITHPTGIETPVDDRVRDLRHTPAVAIIAQKTSPGTQGVLTKIALGSSDRFAAFDDLVTLTVRAADGEERHGPCLPEDGYTDAAPCDSNLSPSPLGKHYRICQPLPCSHCVLAHGHDCKTFAHEGWLVCNERWPEWSLMRTDRWPTHAFMGKPAVYCSQAATNSPLPRTV